MGTQLARDVNGAVIQAPHFIDGTEQSVATTATSTQSTTFGVKITLVRLKALTEDCRVAFGADPTATGTSTHLTAGGEYFVGVQPGTKLACIRATASDGTLEITECGPPQA